MSEPTSLGIAAWPSTIRGIVSAPPFDRFSRLNAPARSLDLLRFATEVARGDARTGLPRGELLLGQDLLKLISVFISFFSPVFLCRSPGAPPTRVGFASAVSPKPGLRAGGARERAVITARPEEAACARAGGGDSRRRGALVFSDRGALGRVIA